MPPRIRSLTPESDEGGNELASSSAGPFTSPNKSTLVTTTGTTSNAGANVNHDDDDDEDDDDDDDELSSLATSEEEGEEEEEEEDDVNGNDQTIAANNPSRSKNSVKVKAVTHYRDDDDEEGISESAAEDDDEDQLEEEEEEEEVEDGDEGAAAYSDDGENDFEGEDELEDDDDYGGSRHGVASSTAASSISKKTSSKQTIAKATGIGGGAGGLKIKFKLGANSSASASKSSSSKSKSKKKSLSTKAATTTVNHSSSHKSKGKRRAYDDISDISDDDQANDAYVSDGSSVNSGARLTARQRAKEMGGDHGMELESLSNDIIPRNKVKLSEAEAALRRSENLRKRRSQANKKLDDEKTETINRLLKKQVGRQNNRGGKGTGKNTPNANNMNHPDAMGMMTSLDINHEAFRPPTTIRWISSIKEGELKHALMLPVSVVEGMEMKRQVFTSYPGPRPPLKTRRLERASATTIVTPVA